MVALHLLGFFFLGAGGNVVEDFLAFDFPGNTNMLKEVLRT